jgi:hypothetical protein
MSISGRTVSADKNTVFKTLLTIVDVAATAGLTAPITYEGVDQDTSSSNPCVGVAPSLISTTTVGWIFSPRQVV